MLLARKGVQANHKRVYRLWRQAQLQVPKKVRRRRRGVGTIPCKAEHPNHVWTYDFLYDTTIKGRKYRILTVMDEFTREGQAVKVAASMPASFVIGVLGRLFAAFGRPRFLRSDNGPEFVAKAVQGWLKAQGTQTIYIEPGKPWQNGYGESFNSKLRDECLNANAFVSVIEASVELEAWRTWYNRERPHSSLGYQTPAEFKQRCCCGSPASDASGANSTTEPPIGVTLGQTALLKDLVGYPITINNTEH